MEQNVKKKIREILADYNIEDSPNNFNIVTQALLYGKNIDIYHKILQLAPFCIITNENFHSLTCEIEISKNKQLLEDINKLFFIKIMKGLPADFRSNLFLRIIIYKW